MKIRSSSKVSLILFLYFILSGQLCLGGVVTDPQEKQALIEKIFQRSVRALDSKMKNSDPLSLITLEYHFMCDREGMISAGLSVSGLEEKKLKSSDITFLLKYKKDSSRGQRISRLHNRLIGILKKLQSIDQQVLDSQSYKASFDKVAIEKGEVNKEKGVIKVTYTLDKSFGENQGPTAFWLYGMTNYSLFGEGYLFSTGEQSITFTRILSQAELKTFPFNATKFVRFEKIQEVSPEIHMWVEEYPTLRTASNWFSFLK